MTQQKRELETTAEERRCAYCGHTAGCYCACPVRWGHLESPEPIILNRVCCASGRIETLQQRLLEAERLLRERSEALHNAQNHMWSIHSIHELKWDDCQVEPCKSDRALGQEAKQ